MEVSFRMASGIVKEKQYLSIFIMIAAFIANYFYKVSAIVLILICIALGVVLTLYRKKMAELHPEVHFYKVDIDEDMDLATRFKVMSVPTLLYFRSSSVFFCIKPLSLFFSQSKKTPEYDILMIPKAKGYKSDASILAGGILNLRPSKNMSRKPENQQEKHQRGRRFPYL